MNSVRHQQRHDERLLRAQDVADFCAISIRQVWLLMARGELPVPVKLGRSTRWRQSDLLRWIAVQSPVTSSGPEAQLASEREV